MNDEKTTLIAELDAAILRLSRKKSPDLETIADLEKLKALIETANAEELAELSANWELAEDA